MILFVDDEPRRMDSFVRELKFLGYEVEFKQDVDSAFEYLQNNHSEIKLLILDILMPSGKITQDMNTEDGVKTGICFLQITRKNFLDIPILVFSSININEELNKIISEDENTRFLAKFDYLPFELADQVEKILA